ncbi:hypothetical protein PVAG01_10956 [Phlyctema vagabunda]|uniref:Integral membrane protein n=1 Tax=Phlyctema vagabunda TaxID=108571 RepID=A0ABR4P3Q3_9HELO
MFSSKPLYIFIASLLHSSLATAQQAADGVIVPFTSTLPSCASQCGPLYDAQGACSPPVQETSSSCFCAYSTLQPFLTSSAGVCDTVCDAAGLTSIRDWFTTFCNIDSTATTTSSTSGSTSTSSSGSGSGSGSNSGNSSKPYSWMDNHWQWVVMIVILGCAFIFGWIGAYYLRKRILQKREKQFEMSPPVAWGPHQVQGAPGGHNYGDGVVPAGAAGGAGTGRGSGPVTNEKMPAEGGKKNRNWLRKNRS